MSLAFDAVARWSVDHRWSVVLLILLLSGVSIMGYVDPELVLMRGEDSKGDLITQSPPSGRPARPQVDPFTLSRGDAVLVADSDSFFTPEGAEAMRAVVDDLERLDYVERIVWMDRIPILNIFGLQEPLFPKNEASPERFEEAKQKALNHPLVGGQLLSSDAKTQLLLVTFDPFRVLSDDDATIRLREVAEAAAKKFPDFEVRFQVTGRIPAAIAAIESHESNQLKFQLIGYGVIILMTIILFRGIRAVLIVAMAPGLGVFWTLGVIQFLHYENNPLVDVIVPILVSLVGLTDGVHLMVQIRKLRVAGQTEASAAKLGIQQVGMACFLTSLTTAIGFGSLMLADSQWVREFGACSVIGVGLTFVAVVTVIPFLCSTPLGRNLHVGHEGSLIDRNLDRITIFINTALKRPKLLSAAGIALTIAFFAISFLKLTPDQRQSDGLPERAEATKALHHVDERFGGLEFARVDVYWSDKVPDDSAEILRVVAEIDDYLNTEDLIGHPLSIRNLIDAQPGSGPPEERMTLIDLLPPPLKVAFFEPDRNYSKITFRVQDLGIAKYGPVFERLEEKLATMKAEHPEFHFDLNGAAVWRWENLYQIVVDLAASLGAASVIIFIVLAVVYRSIRLGLISIIPNMFPLVFTGAFLAWLGYSLEIVMVCSFTVCLGIAVDDTIHFLTRYLEEREHHSEQDAIRRAFTGVGTALIMTTTVLVVGFSTVIFSESRDHKIFAMMGALTISAALFGDLIFLPALLAAFGPKRVDTPAHRDSTVM